MVVALKLDKKSPADKLERGWKSGEQKYGECPGFIRIYLRLVASVQTPTGARERVEKSLREG
jgi:hypothetical protein